MAKQRTAAQKVIDTVQILESILERLPDTGRSDGDRVFRHLLQLQRVSSTFRRTIRSSPRLCSTLFLDQAPRREPNLDGISTGFAYKAHLEDISAPTAVINPFFRSDPPLEPDTIWNTIKDAPKL